MRKKIIPAPLLKFLTLYSGLGYIMLSYSFLYYGSSMVRYCGPAAVTFSFSAISIAIFCLSLILACASRLIDIILNSIIRSKTRPSIYPVVTVIFLFMLSWTIARYTYLFVKDFSFIRKLPLFYSASSAQSLFMYRSVAIAVLLTAALLLKKNIFQEGTAFMAAMTYCSAAFVISSTIIFLTALFTVLPRWRWEEAVYGHSAAGLAAEGIKKPNVLLIVCDSLSAPHMSLYGYWRETTPNIDIVAAESCVFDNMHASSNGTVGSWPGILEGVYQATHKKFYSEFLLPSYPAAKTLAYFLSSAGYSTYGIGIPYIQEFGYEKSFQHVMPESDYPKYRFLYRVAVRNKLPLYIWCVILKYDFLSPVNFLRNIPGQCKTDVSAAGEEMKRLNMLKETAISADRPFFVCCNLFIPSMNESYRSPKKYRGRFSKREVRQDLYDKIEFNGLYPAGMQEEIEIMRDIYDEAVLYGDCLIGELVKFLEDKRLFDNTILVITSDHGQSFSRGYLGHTGPLLHEELTRIPLIIHMPGQRQGKRIEMMADHTDITPTILEMCGITIPASLEGESLVKYMENPALQTGKVKFSMVLDIFDGSIRGGIVAAYKDGYKSIYDLSKDKSELYDLRNDPEENIDISDKKKDMAEGLKKAILETVASKSRKNG